jgi:ABC-2 type transport system ATP-binding protein
LIADIENVLDDVVLIKNGSIVAQTTVDEIRTEHGKTVDQYFREVFAC